MTKKTLLYLSVATLVLYVIGRFFLLDAAANSHNSLFALIALLVYPVATGILFLITWIMGLVKTAKMKRWGWFAALFFLTPITSLLFGLIGPEDEPEPMPMNQYSNWQ
jgi:uncharacterized membrane protein